MAVLVLIFLVSPQVLAIKSCQKNQKLCQKLKGYKKKTKKDFQPLAGPSPEDRKIFFFWGGGGRGGGTLSGFGSSGFGFFGTFPGFGNKILPKTWGGTKKNKNFLPKTERVTKKTKKENNTDFQPLAGPRPEDRKICFLFLFGTSSGFGNKIVPKPEEVPKTIINIHMLLDTTPFQLPDSGFGFQGSA